MATEKIIIGIVFILAAIIFFFNNKKIAKGMSGFYRMLYTKKNLAIIFRILAIILFVGGILLIFLD